MANPSIRAIAFDCYGTLVDFSDEQFIDAYEEICRRLDLATTGRELWDKWMDIWRRWSEAGRTHESPPGTPKLIVSRPLSGPVPPFRAYREEWPEHFEAAFAELGVSGPPEAGALAHELLRERLATAVAFAETREVLASLRESYTLAILSNADDDFLDPCLERNGIEVDLVESSERAGVYKPHEAIFHRTAERLGVAPQELLYVGDSHYADVLGAKQAGLPMAWINPKQRPLPEGVPPPDFEVRSLRELRTLSPLRAQDRV